MPEMKPEPHKNDAAPQTADNNINLVETKDSEFFLIF
jgi:hypothetical protein